MSYQAAVLTTARYIALCDAEKALAAREGRAPDYTAAARQSTVTPPPWRSSWPPAGRR